MGSILAVDYGLKRIGFAISDPNRLFAFPQGVVENKNLNYVLSYINGVVNEKEVDLIVVGIPYNMDRSKSEMTSTVETFVKKLQENLKGKNIKIETIDERLTTFVASENLKESGISLKKSKRFIDIEASRLILENYIEKIQQK